MSTNYYIRENICECCNRYDEKHIGKSSGGRQFLIRHHKDKYNSFDEFKQFIKDKRIFDEYGTECLYQDFVRLINMKKDLKCHELEEKLKDIDGYYFLDCEFS